jgi:hypothetical protein
MVEHPAEATVAGMLDVRHLRGMLCAFGDDSPVVSTFEEESLSMNQEEQVSQARPPAAPVAAEEPPVQKLERLGIRGILWQLARDGQLIDVRC